ncbi:MAG TPA: recombination protein RecR [Flavobacteriales bacterium]|nr:recombination protein RecR [Flavobacteriales bacterium]HIA12726.1 recombination protein RecR [Flavobacteriales bacterium]HIO72640.1 recombination protein RecR [Flavobacteriales bacterium]
MNLSSSLVERAVEEFSRLPGIGKRTALRLVLHLLNQEESEATSFGEAIIKLRKDIKYCEKCNNISDLDICEICTDHNRDQTIICVVEDIRDVMAIEHTQQYPGVYHVLGGIINPMNGIGPGDLNINSLLNKFATDKIKEVILALSSSMEGDTTSFYLYKKIEQYQVPVTIIARGIAVGDELEFVDDVTLARSIINRTPYESVLTTK